MLPPKAYIHKLHHTLLFLRILPAVLVGDAGLVGDACLVWGSGCTGELPGFDAGTVSTGGAGGSSPVPVSTPVNYMNC